MIRVALFLALVFLVLALLRALRQWLAPRRTSRGPSVPREAEMVRDPVCGTWIDRRLALTVERRGETVPVCSERCRKLLEAG